MLEELLGIGIPLVVNDDLNSLVFVKINLVLFTKCIDELLGFISQRLWDVDHEVLNWVERLSAISAS